MTFTGLVQRHRRWRLRRHGLALHRSCVIGPGVRILDRRQPPPQESVRVGEQCELAAGVELNVWSGSITLGCRVFLGPYVVIYGHGGVQIGDHSLLSMHCCVLSSEHAIPPPDKLIRDEPDKLMRTCIGRDVWLGVGVKVLGGVTIGDGCIVGAGAVVTRSLPPYSISVGVPALIIGERKW